MQNICGSVVMPENTDSDAMQLAIHNFFDEPRIAATSSVLDFWKSRKSDALYALACVVLAVPVTQVTVERNFATLKYILSDLRCRLTKKNLESILLIKLNSQFESSNK